MANTKEVQIEAIVPFDWASHLDAEEAQIWAAWTLGPSTGLEVAYLEGQAPNVPSEHGGIVTRYVLQITGTEAIREGVLVKMVHSLRRQKYTEITVAESRDLDNDEPWYHIRTPEEQAKAEAAAKAHVDEMMRGKHWETVDLGDGVSKSRLVPDEEPESN